MSEQVKKSSWDDLADILGADATSQTAEVRHSKPVADPQPEKITGPPSADPPSADPPSAGPASAGPRSTGPAVAGSGPPGPTPTGRRTQQPGLGGWGTLASELGLSMPDSTASDEESSSEVARSEAYRKESSRESNPTAPKTSHLLPENVPAVGPPHRDDSSAGVDDSNASTQMQPAAEESDLEESDEAGSDHGPPKRKRRRRGRRRFGSKDEGSDKLDGSQSSPTDSVVEASFETDESESTLDDPAGGESDTSPKRRRRRRRRGRGRGRPQRSSEGESVELHTPRSTDWLEESQDVANNDTDDRDADNGTTTDPKVSESDRPGDDHSGVASGSDEWQDRIPDADSAVQRDSLDSDSGRKGVSGKAPVAGRKDDSSEKSGSSENRDSRRPRRRRGRRRSQASDADSGPRRNESDSQASRPTTERSNASEVADWTDCEAAEGDIGDPMDASDVSAGKRTSHKNIPSWEEAIGMIVETNLENRTTSRGRNAPSGPKSRSREHGRRE